jgi:capsule polysaccharide modification protein KpsS
MNISNLNKKTNLRKYYYSCYDRKFNFGNLSNQDKNIDEIITNLLHFFNHIIIQEKIDLILYENVSNSFAYVAYELANKNNIKYFGLIAGRIPNRFEIWEDEYGNIKEREKHFNYLLEEKTTNKDKDLENAVKKYLEIFTTKEIKPDYMKKNPTSMHMNYFLYYIKKINIMIKLFEYYSGYAGEVKNAYQSRHPLKSSVNSVLRHFKRSFKIKVIKKMYDESKIYEDNYFIFPMHFQPESSTSVNAMYYDNQYEAIKNIVFSLPIGTYLYIKDHPNGIGFQSIEFYRKLKKLPHVKYIDPAMNTKELIKNSKGVITLTSTMGYEALLLEKPVITLGKVFYNYHPYCYNVSSYSEIYDSVIKVLYNNHEKFKDYNLKFLYVYFQDTYEGRVFKEDTEIKKICDYIIERVNNKRYI